LERRYKSQLYFPYHILEGNYIYIVLYRKGRLGKQKAMKGSLPPLTSNGRQLTNSALIDEVGK